MEKSLIKIMTEQKDNSDQILIKIEGSPYYVVQPPAYNWDHVDTKAHLDYVKSFFSNKEQDTKTNPVGPKIIEPWKYKLASEYNNKYNEKNNINPYKHMESYSSEESDDENGKNI